MRLVDQFLPLVSDSDAEQGEQIWNHLRHSTWSSIVCAMAMFTLGQNGTLLVTPK